MLGRTNGKNVLTAPYIEYANWYKGIAANGQPIRDPEKEAMVNGSLTSPTSNGGTGWPNPAFKPDTGLFYVGVTEAFSIFYRTDLDSKPEGYGGLERGGVRYLLNCARSITGPARSRGGIGRTLDHSR